MPHLILWSSPSGHGRFLPERLGPPREAGPLCYPLPEVTAGVLVPMASPPPGPTPRLISPVTPEGPHRAARDVVCGHAGYGQDKGSVCGDSIVSLPVTGAYFSCNSADSTGLVAPALY